MRKGDGNANWKGEGAGNGRRNGERKMWEEVGKEKCIWEGKEGKTESEVREWQ